MIDPITPISSMSLQQASQDKSSQASFADWYTQEVSKANDSIQAAEKQLQLFAVGEVESVHEVMLAISKAKSEFELLVQVRNRLVETAKDMMRMSI